jgi:tetratricopeptide (TPR) repeat protein
MLRPVTLLAAALLSTTTLAKAAPREAALRETGQAGGISPYAAYLVGRHALAQGDRKDGVAALEALAQRYPDQPALRLKAFEAALFAGDVDGAASFAPAGPSAEDPFEFASLGRLVRTVQALSAGKAGEAARQLDLKAVELPYRSAAFMLKPWVLAANGDWTGALAKPSDGDRVAELVAGLGRAELLEIHGQRAEAEAAYKEITADALGQKLFKTRYGEFLERTGRTKDAIAVYDAALKLDPDNIELGAAQERAKKGGRPPAAPNLRQGAAQALTFAAVAVSGRYPAIGLDYLHLALKLDPTQDQALIMLGDDMAELKDGPAAREAWSKVPEASHLYVDARSRAAYSLTSDGDNEGAIKLARALTAAQPHDPTALFTLADVLRTAEKDAEALQVLDQIETSGGGTDWRVRYMRAITLDRLGRWSDAEGELKRALELAPEQPDVENYLGYSWIDRGDRVKEGLALVEKAVAARPNSGAMQDSLGWAHYRLGDYKAAVNLLEKAVELEPADPDINDHLGDAYWLAGRKGEAGFQWNRVLSLSPDAKLKAAVEHKLKDGVTAQVAAR